jgi:hypothetical protein
VTAEDTAMAEALSEWIKWLALPIPDGDEDRITVAMTLIVGPAFNPGYTLLVEDDGEYEEGDTDADHASIEGFPTMQAAVDRVRALVIEHTDDELCFRFALREMDPEP